MKPNLHLIERDERRGRRLPALALLAVIALLASALTGLFGFLEVNAAYGTAKDLEATYICEPDQFDLTFPDLSRLSTVYTGDGVLIGQLTERNSQPAAIKNVPDVVRDAVLAAEDSDFYEHEGLDFKGILRAALENFRSDAGLQGGSTITQQVVKMNFLSTEVTLERKICEGVIAAELERRYTKDQILEFYMNSVFYGANAYGIRAAAREYFDKPLAELSIAEAATIVVPIRNPSFYNIRSEPERVERARNDVIENMAENGFITEAEAAEAIATPLEPAPHRDLVAENPEILIAAREQLLNDSRFNLGDTYAERKQAIYGCPANDTECTGGGGLRITITVNKQWNDEATRILRTWFQDRSGPTGAIAMLDNRTGALRVMASGVEFGTDIEAGQRPYDIVTKGRRQAGSAFKPITLVAALENGSLEGWDITLGTYWDGSSPQEIDCGYPCSDRGNIWTVNNAEGGGGGVVSLESATYNSTNTVYAQVSVAVGPEQSVEMAHRLGIESPLNPVPSIALGAEAVSPFEMAAAYSTIANYGEKVEPYLIERIETVGGEVIYDHRVQRRAGHRRLDGGRRGLDAGEGGLLRHRHPRRHRPAPGGEDRYGAELPGRVVRRVHPAVHHRGVVRIPRRPDRAVRLHRVQRAGGGPAVLRPGVRRHADRADLGPVHAVHHRRPPRRGLPGPPDGFSEWFRIPKTTVPDVSGMSREEARERHRQGGSHPQPGRHAVDRAGGHLPRPVADRRRRGLPGEHGDGAVLVGDPAGGPEPDRAVRGRGRRRHRRVQRGLRAQPQLRHPIDSRCSTRPTSASSSAPIPAPGVPIAEDGAITVFIGELVENGGGGGGGDGGGGNGGDGGD